MEMLFVGILVLIFLASAIKILREYERAVIYTLGRFSGVKGPGLIILIPFIPTNCTNTAKISACLVVSHNH